MPFRTLILSSLLTYGLSLLCGEFYLPKSLMSFACFIAIYIYLREPRANYRGPLLLSFLILLTMEILSQIGIIITTDYVMASYHANTKQKCIGTAIHISYLVIYWKIIYFIILYEL